jgi:hypothetical protein
VSITDLKAQLEVLTRELWFPSETEAPWTIAAVLLEGMEEAVLLRSLHRPAGTPIVEMALDDLLHQVAQRCRGYGMEGEAIAQRHRELIQALQEQCSVVKAFRVGEVTVDVIVVGQTEAGAIALQTQSVET